MAANDDDPNLDTDLFSMTGSTLIIAATLADELALTDKRKGWRDACRAISDQLWLMASGCRTASDLQRLNVKDPQAAVLQGRLIAKYDEQRQRIMFALRDTEDHQRR